MDISKKTLDLLKKAGWTEERRHDISEYEKALEKDGYVLNNVVRDFLSRFGGLEVVHPDHHDAKELDKFDFNAKEATESTFIEVVKEYEERVNEALVVVGLGFNGHMVLVLSYSGKMYAGYDEVLMKLGDTPIKALETLCEGKGKVRID